MAAIWTNMSAESPRPRARQMSTGIPYNLEDQVGPGEASLDLIWGGQALQICRNGLQLGPGTKREAFGTIPCKSGLGGATRFLDADWPTLLTEAHAGHCQLQHSRDLAECIRLSWHAAHSDVAANLVATRPGPYILCVLPEDWRQTGGMACAFTSSVAAIQ